MLSNPEQIRLIMELRRQNILDTKILSAFEKVPRELFVPEAFYEQTYENLPIPIGFGQIMTPYLVLARMLVHLELNDRSKVLEIGTGTGYGTALLARLARRVYTIEIYKELIDKAKSAFDQLEAHTISFRQGNGSKGWKEQAPFDRIIVNAFHTEIPEMLLEQLNEGGILLMPVGSKTYDQKLIKVRCYRKCTSNFDPDNYSAEEILPIGLMKLVLNDKEILPKNNNLIC